LSNLVIIVDMEPVTDRGTDAAPTRRPRHDGWTPERTRAFLDALADCGSVRAAAAHVGLSVQSAYRQRRAPGAKLFRESWDAALEAAFHALTDVAMDRAINGVEKPYYYQGELIATHRVYSDQLLMFMMRHRTPFAYSPLAFDTSIQLFAQPDPRETAVRLTDVTVAKLTGVEDTSAQVPSAPA
jgi:hypothetical protein